MILSFSEVVSRKEDTYRFIALYSLIISSGSSLLIEMFWIDNGFSKDAEFITPVFDWFSSYFYLPKVRTVEIFLLKTLLCLGGKLLLFD